MEGVFFGFGLWNLLGGSHGSAGSSDFLFFSLIQGFCFFSVYFLN
jgi:hypothetical protein